MTSVVQNWSGFVRSACNYEDRAKVAQALQTSSTAVPQAFCGGRTRGANPARRSRAAGSIAAR